VCLVWKNTLTIIFYIFNTGNYQQPDYPLCPSSVSRPSSPPDTCVFRHGRPEEWRSRLRASVTHLRMDLYLQHRTRKQLVNPFSLRPLICSYLLQQPKKSQGIFSSLFPIDPALRKSALLSKHYWSLPLNDRLLHQCIKALDELKFHFRQLVPVIFTLFSIVGTWELVSRQSQRVDQCLARRWEGRLVKVLTIHRSRSVT